MKCKETIARTTKSRSSKIAPVNFHKISGNIFDFIHVSKSSYLKRFHTHKYDKCFFVFLDKVIITDSSATALRLSTHLTKTKATDLLLHLFPTWITKYYEYNLSGFTLKSTYILLVNAHFLCNGTHFLIFSVLLLKVQTWYA